MHEPIEISTETPKPGELPAINAVVEAALTTWDLPARVRRLVLPSYRYQEIDLAHLGFALARDHADAGIAGVAAWETADRRDCPSGHAGLLLHGLYVDPARHGQRIGSRLLAQVADHAAAAGLDGVLVRAQRDAEGFFERQGMQRLAVADEQRDYAGRYWLRVGDRRRGLPAQRARHGRSASAGGMFG
jgi:GNAT superfamily N-acetyltransferase